MQVCTWDSLVATPRIGASAGSPVLLMEHTCAQWWCTKTHRFVRAHRGVGNTPESTCRLQSDAKLDPIPSEWTGTFRDARGINPLGPQPENELLGLAFAVNAQRVDSLAIPACFAQLRFWRHTRVAQLADHEVYVTLPGVIGHEWDIDVDNGFRPAGLVHLSSTYVADLPCWCPHLIVDLPWLCRWLWLLPAATGGSTTSCSSKTTAAFSTQAVLSTRCLCTELPPGRWFLRRALCNGRGDWMGTMISMTHHGPMPMIFDWATTR